MRHGGSEALVAVGVDHGAVDREVFAQWAVDTQLRWLADRRRGDGGALYLDLPLGTGPGGFDVWDEPDAYVASMTIGAPPDRFFPDGQEWGLCPPHPGRMVGPGSCTAGFVAALDAHMSHCSILRIDHVMGLERLFWVPIGRPSSEGTYVAMPSDALWRVVAERSQRHGVSVVGEDLGTVSAASRAAMARHGSYGLFVGQDHLDPRGRLTESPSPSSVASLNTHDLPTFAGHPDLAALPVADVRARRDHVLAEMARSDAALLMVGEADLRLDPRRFNLPGTVGGDNWRLRSTVTVEQTPLEVLESAGRWRRRRLVESTGSPDRRDDVDAGWGVPLDVGPDDEEVDSFMEGHHVRLGDRFGVHPRTVDGLRGADAVVWAPHGTAVAVERRGEDGTWERTMLVPRGGGARSDSGLWYGFVPGLLEDDRYRLAVTSASGAVLHKTDPFARAAELPPDNSAVLAPSRPRIEWGDGVWMDGRAARHSPDHVMSFYEVHLGSWRRGPDGGVLGYRDVARRLAEYVADMGFTHVELMPVMEHPFGGSWGYHVTGYFAPTARYGNPDDFAAFVDICHRHGVGVCLDWVPAHFPDDPHGLARFDGEPLFEYADPRMGRHPHWGSNVFDVSRPEVRSFLMSSAMFWLDHFHVDALRVDAVASMLYRDFGRAPGEWLPNDEGGREHHEAVRFFEDLTTLVGRDHPDVLLIAEESSAWPAVTWPVERGGLGFGLKWDLGWMNDTLRYFARDDAGRRGHLEDLTFRSMYAPAERFVVPLSHDEVVHEKASLLDKMPGDLDDRLADLRLLFTHQFTTTGVPLLFMGGELAMRREWDHDTELPWALVDDPDPSNPHAAIRRWVRHLARLQHRHPALAGDGRHPGGFEWTDDDTDDPAVRAWLRRRDASSVAVVVNHAHRAFARCAVEVDEGGSWRVIADGDATHFGGRGRVAEVLASPRSPADAAPAVEAEPIVGGYRRWAVHVPLPPRTAIVLAREERP
ncbi:MAG: 1,4-alpha-glucan branching protein GlgB [Microthrixaceae bacterium]